MPLRSRTSRLLAGLLALAVLPAVASAHEIAGTRFEAPIPLHLLFAGAGAMVALTAVALAATDVTLSGNDREVRLGIASSTTATGIRYAARGLFLFVLLFALADGLFGRQVPAENLATVFVWPVWIKGVAVLAVLVGNPWPVLSPWRTIYDGLARLEGQAVALFDYPEWLGRWPALVGFVALIGVVENLTTIPNSPRATAVVVLGYALIMVLGAVAFGPVWLRRADAFAVLYRLLGRVAPLSVTRNSDGGCSLAVVPPWRGTTASAGELAIVGFVVAAVYTVSFDGFTSTPEYQSLLFAAHSATGLEGATALALYVAGLTLFVGVYLLVSALTAWAGEDASSTLEVAQAFALTIVPIAAAYEIAHNYPFVVENLVRVCSLAYESLFGLHLALAPLTWLSLPAFWASQVALIVGGHLVAVVAAHFVAADRFPRVRRALVPLTALMVGYTAVSLWIISRPVASG